MKIGFFDLGLKNPTTKASFQGMYQSFWNALEEVGAKTELFFSATDSELDVIVVPLGSGQEVKSARVLANSRCPGIIYVPPAKTWFRKSFLQRWRHKILFAYGTDVSGYSDARYRSLGIPYHHFPFASDKQVFRPLEIEKLYDIIFVGSASSGEGRHKYIGPLMQRAREKKWKVLLLGNGWDKYGYTTQLVSHGELLNAIYNSGQICINIVNKDQFYSPHLRLDTNNRLFDLAMAGCFQVANARLLTSKYFESDEIVSVDNPQQWLDLVDYYLDHPDERTVIAERSRQKALADHSWEKRSAEFLGLVYHYLKLANTSGVKDNRGVSALQKLDTVLPPGYWIMSKAGKLLNKLT